jgi:hypothetical protein
MEEEKIVLTIEEEKIVLTIEEIKGTIKAARDSVWVIEDTINQISNGATFNQERKENIERNVDHLKIVTSKEEIIASGEDISDLLTGIESGEAKLSEFSE